MGAKFGHKQFNTGRTHFKKGHIPWIKGKEWSEEMKRKISKATKGSKRPPRSKEHREKISELRKREWKLGLRKPPTEETRRKMSESHKGNKSHLWRGGISKTNRTERENTMSSIEYKLWRKSVFERDNFTCQKYGIRGSRLVAHHINNFEDFPELHLAIDNGITLSEKAHRDFHKIYGVKNNTREQLEEFMKI